MLDVKDTTTDEALDIAASKSNAPVISMSPNPLVPPTIPANWVVPVPALIVRFLAVPSELTVSLKTKLESVVDNILAVLNVVAPE